MNTQKGFASILIILAGLVVIGMGLYYSNTLKIKTPIIADTNFSSTTTDIGTQISTVNTSSSVDTSTKTSMTYAEGSYVEDFLKKYTSSISSNNVLFIKDASGYLKIEKEKAAFNYSWISYIQEGDIIYFTLREDTGVYGLNLKTNELKTLFDKVPENYNMRLIGKQNNKILLEKIESDNSPGPCFNIWVYSFEEPNNENLSIKSLDINNASANLSSFFVSKEIYEEQKINVNLCIANLDRDEKLIQTYVNNTFNFSVPISLETKVTELNDGTNKMVTFKDGNEFTVVRLVKMGVYGDSLDVWNYLQISKLSKTEMLVDNKRALIYSVPAYGEGGELFPAQVIVIVENDGDVYQFEFQNSTKLSEKEKDFLSNIQFIK